MGSAVSFNKRTDAAEASKKTTEVDETLTGSRQGAPGSRVSHPLAQSNDAHLRVDISGNGRACNREGEDFFPADSPFVLRSAISHTSTTFSTPPRAASNRSLGSSSSHNHHSGPNSTDSRVQARDAVDFLYRRAQLSDTSSPNENNADGGMADVFAQTAMSLGLDNDDLLFNMMFFDDGSLPNFGAMMNTMQQETLALHSENNTPYKLNPANAEAISHLLQEKFCSGEDNECAVCKDEIDVGADIIRIPKCRHYFHAECLSRWIQLVRVSEVISHRALYSLLLLFFLCHYSNLGVQSVGHRWNRRITQPMRSLYQLLRRPSDLMKRRRTSIIIAAHARICLTRKLFYSKLDEMLLSIRLKKSFQLASEGPFIVSLHRPRIKIDSSALLPQSALLCVDTCT